MKIQKNSLLLFSAFCIGAGGVGAIGASPSLAAPVETDVAEIDVAEIDATDVELSTLASEEDVVAHTSTESIEQPTTEPTGAELLRNAPISSDQSLEIVTTQTIENSPTLTGLTIEPSVESLSTDNLNVEWQADAADELSEETAPVLLGQLEGDENDTPKFGKAGTQRWYAQGGVAADLDDDLFGLVGAGASHFFHDYHSVNLELNGLAFSQPGDDAVGLNLAFLFQSHWLRGDNWTVYLDAGAGIIVTTNEVPSDGSSFNFTPQFGAGATFDLGNDKRLMTGIRWHHISNADLYNNNPGLDTTLGYVGLNFPL
ncbi:MAG: acyloxyacyl hydrolase [Cyanobacteria bacterium J06649_4]